MPDPRARVVITAEDRASRALKRIRDEAKGLGKAFNALKVALPVAAFGAATKSALNYADSIADAAERTAFSAGRLQELKFAAEQNGVAFRELEGGLARFTKRLGLARAGTGAAAKTYEQLGINLAQTNEQVFNQVVATLGAMEDETNRLALTTRLFGDDAQRLGVVFKNGLSGLDAYAKRARELGLVLSDELVQGASDANDQLDIMGKVIQAQLARGLVELAPVITGIGQAFADAAPKVAAFFNQFGDVEDLSADNLKRRALGAQKEFERLAEQLARRQAINANRAQGRAGGASLMEYLLLPDEAELREQLAAAEAVFNDAIERIRDKNLALADTPTATTRPAAVDTSALFGGAATTKRSQGLSAAQKEFNRLLAEGKSLTESLYTPQEAYAAQIARLNELNAIGAVNQTTYNRAVAEYQDQLDAASGKTARFADLQRIVAEVDPVAPLLDQLDALEALEAEWPAYAEIIAEAQLNVQDEIDKVNQGLDEQADKAKDLESAWQDLGPTFSSAFEDAIIQGDKLSDVVKSIEQDILRIATRQLITAPIGGAISNFFSPTGSGGGFLQSLFGFASGGSFMVGGSGGTDSQLVAFRASPNERVSVETPEQRRLGASTINHFSFVLPADSVNHRRTAEQIAREAGRRLAGAQGAV